MTSEPTEEDREKASSLSGCSAGLIAVALAEERAKARTLLIAHMRARAVDDLERAQSMIDAIDQGRVTWSEDPPAGYANWFNVD